MRGKGTFGVDTSTTTGITPAYAGKSTSSCTACKGCWDHPRLCGEKILPVRYTLPISGSPPPMRGKGNSESNPAKRLRITPAYAGKSKRFCVMLRTVQDHPRLCGEKWVFNANFGAVGRITPAYAGKSQICIFQLFWSEDHPRLCGEKHDSGGK